MSQRLNQVDKSVAKGRLLLVDDEPAVREGLQRVLQVEGFDVATVANCRDAMARLDESEVHLVLLDINVAAESGWDLCRRALAEQPDLRVIMITARPDQKATALLAGVDALMEKPLDLPLLVETVTKLLAKRGDPQTVKSQRHVALSERV